MTKRDGRTENSSEELNIHWEDINIGRPKVEETSGIDNWPQIPNDRCGLKAGLLDICSPERFMNPYDSVKAGKAIEIYKQIMSADADDIRTLSALRKDAEEMLNVHIDAEAFYNHLMHVFSPAVYVKNYNQARLEEYHRICVQLTENRHSVTDMEEILCKITKFNNKVAETATITPGKKVANNIAIALGVSIVVINIVLVLYFLL